MRQNAFKEAAYTQSRDGTTGSRLAPGLLPSNGRSKRDCPIKLCAINPKRKTSHLYILISAYFTVHSQNRLSHIMRRNVVGSAAAHHNQKHPSFQATTPGRVPHLLLHVVVSLIREENCTPVGPPCCGPPGGGTSIVVMAQRQRTHQ